jgi:hypothetical protein
MLRFACPSSPRSVGLLILVIPEALSLTVVDDAPKLRWTLRGEREGGTEGGNRVRRS